MTRSASGASPTAFPGPLSRIAPDIEAAAARGVDIRVKAYAPIEIRGVDLVVSTRGQLWLEEIPGEELVLATEAAGHAAARAQPARCTGLPQAPVGAQAPSPGRGHRDALMRACALPEPAARLELQRRSFPMLHVRARFMSTVAAAVPLIAMLPGCLMDDAGLTAGEPGTTEQALIAELPLVSPAAAAATSAPEMRALRHESPAGDLFALARGRWVGQCDIFVPGQAEPVQSVEMERITEPTGNPDEYTWTIIYRSPDIGEDVRPYTVRTTETPGRYVIDEHNGIQLPTYLLNGNLLLGELQISAYDIRLFTRELFQGNKYDIEFTSLSMTPELTSDLGDGFAVDSFRVLSTQRCSLRRQGPRH